MGTRKPFKIIDRLRSFNHAFRGIGEALLSEHNLWLHLVAAALVLFFGLWFDISRSDWTIILICIGSVLAAELFNTSIELLADQVTEEHNVRIGKVKDIAAGGVLVLSITALIIGVLVFLPYFL